MMMISFALYVKGKKLLSHGLDLDKNEAVNKRPLIAVCAIRFVKAEAAK